MFLVGKPPLLLQRAFRGSRGIRLDTKIDFYNPLWIFFFIFVTVTAIVFLVLFLTSIHYTSDCHRLYGQQWHNSMFVNDYRCHNGSQVKKIPGLNS